MSLSMYQASAPVFLRALHNLRAVLNKGEAHAIDKGYDPAVLLQTRLVPDMLPLVRQVQIATDMAKNGCARLAGVAQPPGRRVGDGPSSPGPVSRTVGDGGRFLPGCRTSTRPQAGPLPRPLPRCAGEGRTATNRGAELRLQFTLSCCRERSKR